MFENYIRQGVQDLFIVNRSAHGFDEPIGDAGLFGPGSAAWEVHADFIVMLIGGMSALIMQSLHPGALAGVWDHSNFRDDIKGRLSRTAFFIAATTYGPKQMAMDSIHHVRMVHEKIFGYDQFSKPYRANDPHLLAWVHLTEVTSFLRAYKTYDNPRFAVERQNEYFSEMSLIGESLGCAALPKNMLGSNNQINSYLGELYCGERVKLVLGLLENYPVQALYKPVYGLIMRAALMNLPDWALSLIGRKPFRAIDRLITTIAVRAIAHQVSIALGSSTIVNRSIHRASGLRTGLK